MTKPVFEVGIFTEFKTDPSYHHTDSKIRVAYGTENGQEDVVAFKVQIVDKDDRVLGRQAPTYVGSDFPNVIKAQILLLTYLASHSGILTGTKWNGRNIKVEFEK